MEKSLTNCFKQSSSSCARNPRTRSSASLRNDVPHSSSGHYEHSSPSCARTKFHFVNPRSGFTLIELMISLALGLIIVAAAIQLFIAGVTSYKLQKAMSHIQDSASLGLNFIVDDIRKANLSAPIPAVNDQIEYAGILVSTNNIGEKINLNCPACFDKPDKEGDSKPLKSYGEANVKNGTTQENDQLLIRYQAPQAGFDCSGSELKKDVFVVQRYYVDLTESRRSLRCQAAQYKQTDLNGKNETNKLSLKWGDAQIILPNVDYFAVRYGWMDGGLNDATSRIQYGSLDDYSKQSIEKNIDGVLQDVSPNIHAIQIGVLVQSADTAGNQSIVKERNSRAFQVLGSEVELDKKYQNGHLRQAVNQTISLRNAMGWVSEGCKADVDDCTGGE
ncbi:PilW family protein [Acinetobacter haemolyticus]|uniref:PilW family protein n=1 Tax=Acinetobacter haemolyticus TaxID=29430 RepID=UPI0009B60EB7|nr:PilW family protein [Acinetobacter haemolyticus]